MLASGPFFHPSECRYLAGKCLSPSPKRPQKLLSRRSAAIRLVPFVVSCGISFPVTWGTIPELSSAPVQDYAIRRVPVRICLHLTRRATFARGASGVAVVRNPSTTPTAVRPFAVKRQSAAGGCNMAAEKTGRYPTLILYGPDDESGVIGCHFAWPGVISSQFHSALILLANFGLKSQQVSDKSSPRYHLNLIYSGHQCAFASASS